MAKSAAEKLYEEQERRLNEAQKKRIKEANEGGKFEAPKYQLENTPETAGKKSPTPGADIETRHKTLKEKMEENRKKKEKMSGF